MDLKQLEDFSLEHFGLELIICQEQLLKKIVINFKNNKKVKLINKQEKLEDHRQIFFI